MTNKPSSRSHLFTVRLWPEQSGDGQGEWHGKVQHVLSGEARYFQGWDGLVTLLQETVARIPADQGPSDERRLS